MSDGDKKGIGTKLVNRLSLSSGGVGILGQLNPSLSSLTAIGWSAYRLRGMEQDRKG